MAKDSYWFKHDSTSGRGLRIKKIQHIYGHWGKGVYWDVIEVLREQDNYTFESDESSLQMLSELIGLKEFEKFSNWFNDCLKLGLFKIANNRFFSEVLIENMSNWESKKSNGNKGGRPPKTETETELKPKHKPNQNHNRREEKRREEYKKNGLIFLYAENETDVFKEPKWDIEFTIDKEGQRIYGNGRERLSGGLSEIGIQEHCENRRIKYVK